MGQVEDMFRSIQGQIERSVRYKMVLLGRQLLERALFYRETLVQNNIGHDYTGNLVNSICVGVYFHGDYKQGFFGTKEGLVKKLPRYQKMTTRKSGEPRKYKYPGETRPDYMDSGFSSYDATVKTDAGKVNETTAAAFLKGIRPKGNAEYVLILAYPVEYAKWIEKERSSTGIALVEDEYSSKAKQIARWFVEDIAVDGGNSSLMLDTWVKNLYQQWGGERRENESHEIFDADNASLYYRDMSYSPGKGMTITTADNPTEPFDDPFDGGISPDAPF